MLKLFSPYLYLAGVIAVMAAFAMTYQAGRNSVFNEQAKETIRSVKDAKESNHEVDRLSDDVVVAGLFKHWGI